MAANFKYLIQTINSQFIALSLTMRSLKLL